MTHICVSKLTTIGSDNGLSPGRRQAIIWSNAGILLNWTLGTNFSEILSEIDTFSFKQMRLKMSSGKWRPYCLGLNVLALIPTQISDHTPIVGEIACPFPNSNGNTLDIREWISNHILHIVMDAINYLSIPGAKLNHVSKRGPDDKLSLWGMSQREVLKV